MSKPFNVKPAHYLALMPCMCGFHYFRHNLSGVHYFTRRSCFLKTFSIASRERATCSFVWVAIKL